MYSLHMYLTIQMHIYTMYIFIKRARNTVHNVHVHVIIMQINLDVQYIQVKQSYGDNKYTTTQCTCTGI